MKEYIGTLNYKKMRKHIRLGYWSYYAQKKRAKVFYSVREFLFWWDKNYRRRKTWKRATVSRIDHAQGYSFKNIKLEELVDNIKERNARCGNPGRTHKAVVAYCAVTKRRLGTFKTKHAAAGFFKVSDKTIYNHCMRRTKKYFKYGPKRPEKIFFRWAR